MAKARVPGHDGPASDRQRRWSPMAGRAGAMLAIGLAAMATPVGARAEGAPPPPVASVATVAGHSRPGPGGLDGPTGIALSASGALYIADTGNCRIVKIARPKSARPESSVIAGDGCQGSYRDDQRGDQAAVGFAQGVAVDRRGDVYIAATSENRILELAAPGSRAPLRPGDVSSVAGTGTAGFDGDGRRAAASELNAPRGIAVDASGDLFIADTANCRIRELPAATLTVGGRQLLAGHLYTVAGNGSCGSPLGAGADGDGGPALEASVWTPTAVEVDAAGDLLIGDRGNDEVREVAADSGTSFGVPIAAGHIATVAGTGTGYSPYLVDGLSATGPTAELNFISGLALDTSGDLFVADSYGRAIRGVPAHTGESFGRTVQVGSMYTVAGAVPSGPDQDQSRMVLTTLTYPTGLAIGPDGALYYSDAGANVVRVIRPGR
jgi:sugar lactone lactonase YvrE